MPVLARWIERAGIPTVVVTTMPSLAIAQLAPRVVGVEFPFGHPFGMPNDRKTQRRVLETALTVLAGATSFATRIDLDIKWPQPRGEAFEAGRPQEPSPIVREMLNNPNLLRRGAMTAE